MTFKEIETKLHRAFPFSREALNQDEMDFIENIMNYMRYKNDNSFVNHPIMIFATQKKA